MNPRASIRISVVLLGLLGTAGCADAPTPPPAPPAYLFTPAGDDVTVPYQGQVSFAARTLEGAAVVAVFRRGDTILATGLTYVYAAVRAGRDSLRAEVPGAEAGSKDWRISVESAYGDRPAPVSGLTAVIGACPGTLRVNWWRAAPELNPLPVVRYLVALRHDAPLTELNWDAAEFLEEVPSLEATVGYGYDYAGLAGGDTVWVGVRAEDEAGRLSPLELAPRIRVAGAYRITGTTVGLDGEPLDGILVSVGEAPELRTITTGNGSFNLPGPAGCLAGFRDIDRYVLTLRDETGPEIGMYYDIRTDTLSAAGAYPRPMLLVAARTPQGDPALDPSCGALDYGGNFLTFLKLMTFIGAGGKTRLYRWDHYPIRYWVQSTEDWLAPCGFKMGPLALAAAAAWNVRLGGTFFESTLDSLAADLKIIFRTVHHVYGFTNIVVPYNAAINTAVPIRMEMRLNRDFNYLEYAQGVVLHEFGHALCIGNHSECGDLHIMTYSAHDVPLSPGPEWIPGLDTQGEMEAAISDDEVRLVRYIRNLPQGINMNQYFLY
jgi:hypothetical protein